MRWFKIILLGLAFNQRRLGFYLGSIVLFSGILGTFLDPTLFSVTNIIIGLIILIDATFFVK